MATAQEKEQLTAVDPLPSYDQANDENDGGSTNDAQVSASADLEEPSSTETVVPTAPVLPPKEVVEPKKQEESPLHEKTEIPVQEEAAPPRLPTRPKSQLQINTETLRDAFPGTDSKIIKAVLIASGGKLDPAFNGLLSLSDPSFEPPEEEHASLAPENSREQVLADERYARKLAEQEERRRRRRDGNESSSVNTGRRESPSEFQSFIESDLPVIKDNLQRGFFETQRKVNTWVANWKKKMDGDPPQSLVDQAYDAFSGGGGSSNTPHNPVSANDLYNEDSRSKYRGDGWQTQQPHYGYPRQRSDFNSSNTTRTTGEKQFSDLSLDNNEVPPPRPPRPSAAVLAPKGAEGVSAFGNTPEPTTPSSNKKWQPLATTSAVSNKEKATEEATSNITPSKSNESSGGKAGAAGSDKPDPFFVDDSDEEEPSK